jgi:cytoskeletal protein RodZ
MRDALLAVLETQEPAAAAPAAPRAPRIGQATQVLLESAENPFRSESEVPPRIRRRAWPAALVVLGALALALGVWWPTRAVVATRAPALQPKTSDTAAQSTSPALPATPATTPTSQSANELPWGADLPADPAPQEGEPVTLTAEDGKARARAARLNRHVTPRQAPPEPRSAPTRAAVSSDSPSSSPELRPKQLKVVRQLDF